MTDRMEEMGKEAPRWYSWSLVIKVLMLAVTKVVAKADEGTEVVQDREVKRLWTGRCRHWDIDDVETLTAAPPFWSQVFCCNKLGTIKEVRSF